MEKQTAVQSNFSMKDLLKSVIVEWFLSSTAHALPNIFRTGSVFLKIVWFCCFLASGSYCLYSIGLSMQDFLSYPSYISTKIIQEIPTQFPAVTICNLKTLKKSVSLDYINSVPEVSPEYLTTPYEYFLLRLFDVRSAFTYDTNLNETTKQEMGYELKDMMLTCFFNYEPCGLNDFSYFFDPLHGNCYTFNKGLLNNGSLSNVKTIGISGHFYGLILELFVGDSVNETYNEQSDGLLISIHNQTELPFTEDSRIVAPTGADTDFIVNRNIVAKLEHPYGDCLKDTSPSSQFSSVFFDHIVRTLNMSYLEKYCFSLCLQQEIINKCNCSNTFMPVMNRSSVPYCYYVEELECIKLTISSISGQKGATEGCEKACPFPCDYIDYEISTFSTRYPTDFYKEFLLNNNPIIQASNVNENSLDKSLVKVNIYYKNMGYTLTEQKISTSTEMFFSNIGGTLGLYLGISILSIVEIVELAYNLINALYMYSKSLSVAPSIVVEEKLQFDQSVVQTAPPVPLHTKPVIPRQEQKRRKTNAMTTVEIA